MRCDTSPRPHANSIDLVTHLLLSEPPLLGAVSSAILTNLNLRLQLPKAKGAFLTAGPLNAPGSQPIGVILEPSRPKAR